MMITRLETLAARAIGTTALPLTRDAIEACQAKRLRRLVTYCCERSPYYRRTLAGLGPIRTLDDLAALPLLTEAMLRRHGSELVCVGQDEVARIVTVLSSGTTGEPKRLCFTEADLEQTLEFFHLGMQHLVEPGQTVAILLPGATPDSTGHLLARALARMQVDGRVLGLVSDPEAMARTLAECKADALVGFPVQILAVARMAAFLGLRLAPLCKVLLCSDYIPESLCRCLHDLLGCEVFSHYGTVETGLGGGVDCSAHCGCHLRETDLMVEIVDAESGMPLPEERWGEIVCTTLARTGMPLIRYRTGDLGRLLPGRCPCGSVIRRLDRVRGRLSRIRTLAGGIRISLPDLDESLFPVPGLLDFAASLEDNTSGKSLRLCLTTLPGSGETVRRLAGEALTRLPSLRGAAVRIDLSPDPAVHSGKRTLHDHRKDNRT